MSTVHISPFGQNGEQERINEYLRVHNAGLTRFEREFVSEADGRRQKGGTYTYEEREGEAEVWLGGSLATIRPVRPVGAGNGGDVGAARGKVDGFSSASRRRLMRTIAKTDRKERPLFVTLTYPDLFPESKRKWKRDIDVLGKRFSRQWPDRGLVWRIEFKERKSGANRGKVAPHFHLLVWGVDVVSFREWADKAWYGVVGSGDKRHLAAGVSAERLKGWRGVMRYVSKYITKLDKFPEGWKGRVWGAIGRDAIPWAVKVVFSLEERIAVRAVRLGRKMLGMTGKVLPYGLTWIVRGERMLDYLEWATEFG